MRPHVLFVDDEKLLLAGLENRLRRHRNEWRITFCTSPEAGLDVMRHEPASIVVSDLRMPTMDGAAFLAGVRARAPSATRVILSGQGDGDVMARAMDVAHEVLPKPCDASRLEELVDRRLRLEASLPSRDVLALVASAPELPPAPRAYRRVDEVIGRANWSMADVAAAIELDPSIAAKIVRVAASPFFGIRRTVKNLHEALVVLGVDAVKRLVLVFESTARTLTLPASSGESYARIAAHGQSVAQATAERAARSRAGDAYVAGLVHDLGWLVLALTRPADVQRVTDEAARLGHSRVARERARWGFTHADVGAALLALWGLPWDIVEAVRAHHDDDGGGELGEQLRAALADVDARGRLPAAAGGSR